MVLGRQVDNPLVIGGDERVSKHEERLGLRAGHRGEGAVERGGLVRVEEMQLHPQRLGGPLHRL